MECSRRIRWDFFFLSLLLLLLFQSIKSPSKQNVMHNICWGKKKSISNLCISTVEPDGVFGVEPCTISVMFSQGRGRATAIHFG